MIEKLGLFFNEEVQRLIDSFAYCFKVKITIFSAGMEELIVGLQNPGSHFCQLIQKKLRFRYRCCQQDKLMCKRSEQRREFVVYHCYSGLSESVIPIEIEETVIGYGMLGQFRTVNNLPEEIVRNWIAAGFDRETLQAAFMEQPFFDKTALDNMLRLFSMLISFIVTREYVKIRRPGITEKVIQWMEDHIADRIDLCEVAAAMNRSRSTISHIIKRHLGLSFKQLCILKRIQRFESIIILDPNLSIQEAAARVGYEDPLYFSRIYKKVRLASPSTYIKSIRRHKTAAVPEPGVRV
ncbi:MAG: PocR ligand-binding domain-containing protein [Treponema sp.]|jgi:AraC-like DNA-binding protein|nr:PocR ligand-binding domain-containing protein [Treponema sp.]